MSGPLAWSHRTTEVGEAGLQQKRAATAAERAAIAEALDLISCEELEADYVIRALQAGDFRMTGKISARLTQTCVVTLEPLAQRIEEEFDVDFLPADSLPDAGDAEVEVLSAPEIEPIAHGLIAAGRVIFETLSAALDPYPRKSGARFQWEDPAGAVATGPFAALKKLKDET